jgi:hypothetical protein
LLADLWCNTRRCSANTYACTIAVPLRTLRILALHYSAARNSTYLSLRSSSGNVNAGFFKRGVCQRVATALFREHVLRYDVSNRHTR